MTINLKVDDVIRAAGKARDEKRLAIQNKTVVLASDGACAYRYDGYSAHGTDEFEGVVCAVGAGFSDEDIRELSLLRPTTGMTDSIVALQCAGVVKIEGDSGILAELQERHDAVVKQIDPDTNEGTGELTAARRRFNRYLDAQLKRLPQLEAA